MVIKSECFSKWVYEYGKECPSIKGYYNKIRETLKNIKKWDLYELPEKSIGLEQYQKERNTLEKYWDSFKYNLESQGVFTAEEIIIRAKEIGEQIKAVKKIIAKMEAKEQEKTYKKKLDKRMDLVNYIRELELNDGVDFENMEENEEIRIEYENQELTNLHRNKRYWKNIGSFYNQKFDKKLKWKGKTELISIKIKEEEERLQKIVEADPEKEQSEEKEGPSDDQEIKEKKDEKQEERSIQGIDPEIQKRIIQENEEEEEDEDEIRRENLDLEKSISKIEREKREIEVKMTREKSGSWTGRWSTTWSRSTTSRGASRTAS